MTVRNSTPQAKPAKPSADFPLFPHASGQWAKKVRGQLHYFGRWDDPAAALAAYQQQAADLHAGRRPRDQAEQGDGALTVGALSNRFIHSKAEAHRRGELSPRTLHDYTKLCELMIRTWGKGRRVDDLGPDDFADLRAARPNWGLLRWGVTVQRLKTYFRFAVEARLLDRVPDFGPDARPPSTGALRRHRARIGPRLFTANDIRLLIRAARPALRAQILLGINCALGPQDIGHLPLAAVDLDNGILDFPRPKDGIERRSALWPETVAALRVYLPDRPQPRLPEWAGLLFVTTCGNPYANSKPHSGVGTSFARLCRYLNITDRAGKREFYTLRRTCRTVADEAHDQPAADRMMGHIVPHMSSIYRQGISDERLRAVADHVRVWLFPPAR
jgi:integrase